MATAPPLPNLLAFEAVARRRSFAFAATELHLTPSAVSHQVARLEQFLGVRLLERSAHGVWLTPAGAEYLGRIAGALSALVAASDDIRQGVHNSLYVHAAPSFASLWLMPRLHAFTQARPDISFNLSATPDYSDFSKIQSDLDIRYGVPDWPDLVVEPLFEERIQPLASPSFVRSHRLKRPEQLFDLPLIQSNLNVVQWPDWFGQVLGAGVPERCRLRFDRSQMALDAAALGQGVALESDIIAAQHVASHRLRPLFSADKAVVVKAHFVVYPQRHARREPVQAFVAWLHREAALAARLL